MARQHEIDEQRRLLIIGLIFTIPLFLFSMGMDFGLLPAAWMEQTWVDAGHVRPGHAGAVLRGLAVLCRRVQVAAQPLGQHGRADRHGLVGGVLSISIFIMLGLLPGMFISRPRR